MADDFSAKLNGILSDPAAMQQVMSIASELLKPQNSQAENQVPSIPVGQSEPNSSESFKDQHHDLEPAIQVSAPPKLQNDARCELLCALKPFLRVERAEKIDMMIRVLQISKFVKRH